MHESIKEEKILQRHLLAETNEKPLSREVSGRAFKNRGYLKSHVRIQVKEEPYSFDGCAAVFVRIEYAYVVHVHLLAAKSRVAPVKIVTIPRLDLLAATVGARLCRSVLSALQWTMSSKTTRLILPLYWVGFSVKNFGQFL
ncbi:hypothetical protein AVEN_254698-1 [Araneus ventricosus]|uniref:Uncharacterized protein n=1 Tax=Araneus ventricosus TaxID=182803 RepID=A0A4Y2UFG1_ARAVE|nr:hypothetical protein AVEN_254698-1 [Araneus ventricosus]